MLLKNKVLIIKSTLFFILLFGGFIPNTIAQNNFQKKVFQLSGTDSLLYNILYPENFDVNTTKKYPLVLFLHGAGERGNDNEVQIIHIKELFLNKANRQKYPCFVIAPQCPKGKKWAEIDWKKENSTMPQNQSISMKMTIDLIDSFTKVYPVDTKRIYITGLSMGGFGTWDAIARYPEKFAAAIPICGGGDESTVTLIKDIPIWAFHGDNDMVVDVAQSRNMVGALKKAGGKPIYTEYKGVGHNSWVKAYEETKLFEWMFGKSRK